MTILFLGVIISQLSFKHSFERKASKREIFQRNKQNEKEMRWLQSSEIDHSVKNLSARKQGQMDCHGGLQHCRCLENVL